MAGQSSRLHVGTNYYLSDNSFDSSRSRSTKNDFSKTFTKGDRERLAPYFQDLSGSPTWIQNREGSEHGARSRDNASTHRIPAYKPNALRSVIQWLEDLKNLDLNEAKSLYLELMKTNRNDELEREETFLEEKKKRETNNALQDGYGRTEIKEQKKRMEQLQEENRALKNQMEQLQSGMSDLQKKYESTKAELESDISRVKNELQQSKEDFNIAVKEKNDALTRLSGEMGTKLNDNNPAIADPTDPNRATKIAERYNELYDNQWTDAMEGLSKYQEKEAIKILLDILKECYQTCEETSNKQLESLQAMLKTPTTPGKLAFQSSASKVGDRITKITNKMLKDCRKLMAEEAVEDIANKLVTRHSGSVDAIFVKKCVELCWLMNVQDPPVVLGKEAQSGEKFNSEEYREYTSTGPTVEYTVWLPLMLHKNGPLLCKGVAQPVKRPKTAPATYRTATKPQETYHPKEERYKPDIFSDVTRRQMSDDVSRGLQGTNVDTGAMEINYTTEVVQPKYDRTTQSSFTTATYRQEPQDFRSTTYSNNGMMNREDGHKVYDYPNKKRTFAVDRFGRVVLFYLYKYGGSLCAEYKGHTYKYEFFKLHLGLRDIY